MIMVQRPKRSLWMALRHSLFESQFRIGSDAAFSWFSPGALLALAVLAAVDSVMRFNGRWAYATGVALVVVLAADVVVSSLLVSRRDERARRRNVPPADPPTVHPWVLWIALVAAVAVVVVYAFGKWGTVWL